MGRISPPYIGAAYYPEVWHEKYIDEDIRLMKETGFNTVRMAEFAWSIMERAEGNFDFSLFHTVMKKLQQADFAVILGTPTCTPPSWLSYKHPEILQMNDRGIRAQHGARRHACPTNKTYRKYVKIIVRKMAEEFASYDNVIGWQIDNEIYPSDRGCCCPDCTRKFRQTMQQKYKTIENLNNAWSLSLWSQAYSSFNELQAPREDTWHHPSLLTAWMKFQSDAITDFVHFQADILKEYTKAPIGTDMMPLGGLSYVKTLEKLDIVQFNHYNNSENLYRAVFWMDFLRTLKDHPFWVTETQGSGCGSTFAGLSYQGPGFCKINSWLPFALGGEANLYWLWRQHKSGQEIMHGSVVDSHGRPTVVYEEIKEVAGDLKKAKDFLNSTKPQKSGIAIHNSWNSWWSFEFQPIVKDLNYISSLIDTFYKPIMHLRPNVIDTISDLEDYKLIISPLLPCISEGALDTKLKKWIENGGVWLAGPLTDIRNEEQSRFEHAPFSKLEDWSGVYCKHKIPFKDTFKAKFADGKPFTGTLYHDIYEIKTATPLVTYTEEEFNDNAAVTVTEMGKGKIILLGSFPDTDSYKKIIDTALSYANITAEIEAPSNLLAIPRKGTTQSGIILIEIENKPTEIEIPYPTTDLLTDTHHPAGKIEINPRSVMVLTK